MSACPSPPRAQIRKTLVDAYALELADERAAHAATRQALADAQSSSTAHSDAAAEAAVLRRRVAELEEQLRVAAGAAGAAAAASRAREDAEQAASALRRQVAMQRSAEEQLRSELAAAQDAAAAAQAQTRAVSETLAALEAAKRAQAWDRYVDGGAAASDHPPLPGVASDWRTWAAEKRELLERANADRSALVEENKRLRASLDTRGVDMEARLRGADHEIAQVRTPPLRYGTSKECTRPYPSSSSSSCSSALSCTRSRRPATRRRLSCGPSTSR